MNQERPPESPSPARHEATSLAATFPRSRARGARAFTLVEALISTVLLAFAAVAVTNLYTAGLHSITSQVESAPLDGLIRGRMERLLSESFDSPQLASGSEEVVYGGSTYRIAWTVGAASFAPISQAKRIDIELAPASDVSNVLRELTTIVAKPEGPIGRIGKF